MLAVLMSMWIRKILRFLRCLRKLKTLLKTRELVKETYILDFLISAKLSIINNLKIVLRGDM